MNLLISALLFIQVILNITVYFIYTKMHDHPQYQISLIKSSMEYVLTGHLFGIIAANIFLI